MTYARRPNYPTVVAKKHPGIAVTAQGNGEIYSMLQWKGASVPQMELDSSRLVVYRERVAERIRLEADTARIMVCCTILGTGDMTQMRTYDDKYREALAWTADNTASTPVLSAECAVTGETLAVLVPSVIYEYEASYAALAAEYGRIEGIRRNELGAIATMTMVQLDAYPGPTW